MIHDFYETKEAILPNKIPEFTITSIEDFNKYTNLYYVCFVFLWAEWCKPCQELKPKLDEYVLNLVYENCCYLKIDFDKFSEDPDFKMFFEKKFIPQFALYYKNEVFRPIIPMDMRFISDFVFHKMKEIEENNKLKINNDI